MTASDTDRLMHELAAIRSYLTAAEDVVKSGHMPDITGLENRVAVVCEAVQNAEKSIQQKCLPELTVMLEKLATFEQAMRDSYEAKSAVKTKGSA